MSNTISIRSLGRQYGYDESTIRQSWIPKGLDMSWPEEQIRAWIVENILKPLRDTDLNEQIQRERLRRMAAEASQAELELDKQLSLVIDTAYLESTLSEFFADMKNYMRTIPQKHYIELFESEDALELKQNLSAFIDSTLNEIGNYEYEMPEEQDEVTDDFESGDQEDSATETDDTV